MAERVVTGAERTHGLVLGKFAPLHKGHQLLLDTARRTVDDLSVLVYDAPQLDTPPLPVRSRWIRDLYPGTHVIEAWGGPTQEGYTPEIKRAHEHYIAKMLCGQRITHFFSSEPYGDHVSASLNARNIMVDEARDTIPVSGTKVRSDPFANKESVDPRVYRDLIANIVFLGAPSTGKSTIAQALAKEYDTQWMPEYGREYWDAHQVDRQLTTAQMVELARGHIEREDVLLAKANTYLFTDTNAITTYNFGMHYHGRVEKELEDLAKDCASRYDLVFLCGDDTPYEDTWDRDGEENRTEMQRRTIAYLQERKIPYIPLEGPLGERIGTVKRVLSQFHKYQNVMELDWKTRH